MIEEKYLGRKETKNGIQAKVILARCPFTLSKSDNVFGMRVQKHGADWYRTWAFKIDMKKAQHEGYDREVTSGTFYPESGYPGCPFCGSISLAQCSCGKSFCSKREEENSSRQISLTCPWCGQTRIYSKTEKLNLEGGDY